jgi:DNA-binding transcriptional MerR regulator
MAYTVHELAKLAGVTVRTLHFYDQLGLLQPDHHGANGYRFYREKELLLLQQILFFRELGMELKEIKRIMGRSDFDRKVALAAHREVLSRNLKRMKKLIQTIDKTLEHYNGKRVMKPAEMYEGFDQRKQAEYEDYLIKRFGEEMREGIAQSRRKVKDWGKAEWERSGEEWNAICAELVAQMKAGSKPTEPSVQNVIRQHFKWLTQFWTPNQESYAGHAQMIVDSDLRKAYDKHHPKLAEFIASGITAYAARELA